MFNNQYWVIVQYKNKSQNKILLLDVKLFYFISQEPIEKCDGKKEKEKNLINEK